jgi:hypothetical protein
MAKRKGITKQNDIQKVLFVPRKSRRRSGLFLRRFITDEATKRIYDEEKRTEAHKMLCH